MGESIERLKEHTFYDVDYTGQTLFYYIVEKRKTSVIFNLYNIDYRSNEIEIMSNIEASELDIKDSLNFFYHSDPAESTNSLRKMIVEIFKSDYKIRVSSKK